MAFVRVYGYPGIVQIEQRLVKQYNSASVFMRCEPYLWSQKLTLTGAAPVEMTVQPNDTATMVIIEVDDTVTVRYELNPGGPLASSHRNASTNSPRLNGIDAFQWFKGATLSFVNAADV